MGSESSRSPRALFREVVGDILLNPRAYAKPTPGRNAMAYLEDLPLKCPPDDATKGELTPLYRLLPADQPKIEHFYSHHKRGGRLPSGLDLCRFASCSLFTCETTARAVVASSPKLRSKVTHVAAVKVDAADGVYLHNEKTKHVDLWPFSTFDVAKAVTGVKAL